MDLSQVRLIDDPEIQLQPSPVAPASTSKSTTELPSSIKLDAGDFAGKRITVEPLKLHMGAQNKQVLSSKGYIAGKSTIDVNPNILLNDLNSGNFTPVGVDMEIKSLFLF
jgi:hypothetical protein